MVILDVDGVICDFYHGFFKHIDVEPPYHPTYDCPIIKEHFSEIAHDESFWMSLEPIWDHLFKGKILLPVDAYLTARPIDSQVTFDWLRKFNFPAAPVWTVSKSEEKVEYLQMLHATIFIDDKPSTYLQVKQELPHVSMFLMDRWYNQDIKANRIKTIHG